MRSRSGTFSTRRAVSRNDLRRILEIGEELLRGRVALARRPFDRAQDDLFDLRIDSRNTPRAAGGGSWFSFVRIMMWTFPATYGISPVTIS
jgi:hypothetical protein